MEKKQKHGPLQSRDRLLGGGAAAAGWEVRAAQG